MPYITVHADMYYLGLGQGDDTITSNELVYGSNHANTIVGFDDNKVADGEIGAFKIVNSWGETWGWSWGGCGYYWITYDAFIDLANAGHPGVKWFDDLVDYKPNLIGTWELDPTCNRDAAIELGIGYYENPIKTRSPYWCCNNLENFQFPEFMCLDVTEFKEEWEINNSNFYLDIGDSITNNGVITSFKIEYYNNTYFPCNPYIISNESLDTPIETPGHVNVIFPVFSNPNYFYVTSLSDEWNFISLPLNQTINKEKILINYNGTDYNWTQATTNENPTGSPIILPFLYTWDRINQNYNFSDKFYPGYGFWMYSYNSCEFWIEKNDSMEFDSYITNLNFYWNIVSIPFNETVEKQDIIVNYNETNYNWIQATTNNNPTDEPIILSFIYDWDRINQTYVTIDSLQPGDSYWFYAFKKCKLLH